MPFRFNARLIARQAIIATLYALLTFSGLGIAYGPIQFRYSEVLNWLAFYDPKNIIGLSIGCCISNITSAFGPLDMAVGTLGTFLATLCMSKSRSKWVATLFPSLFSFLYSAEAAFLGQIPWSLFPESTAAIALSEILIVGLIGYPLVSLLERNTRFHAIVADDTMQPTKASWCDSGRRKRV